MLSNENYQRLFHEIKNVISVIGSSLQLIQKQHPEVMEFSYWKDTMADVSNLQSLILDVSKDGLCENPKKDFVDLYDFLANLRLSTHTLFLDDSFAVFDIASNLPKGYFDPLRIHQALLNLIKNAAEASDNDAKLTVRTYYEGSSLFFEVTDNGPGMSEEVKEQLFVPFYTQKEKGSGLGLSITKGIVEAHGGTITVHSTLGCGSTFTIELPDQPTQNEKSDLMSEVS